MCIRDRFITIEKLEKWQSLTKEAATFLEKLVIAGYNIFVSGDVYKRQVGWAIMNRLTKAAGYNIVDV